MIDWLTINLFLNTFQSCRMPADCVAHTKCGAGFYTEAIGTTSADPICKACEAGQYKSRVSSSSTAIDSCDNHKKCAVDAWVKVAGTTSADTQCLSCPSGHACNGATATACSSVQYVKDNKCEACPSGHSCNGATATACSPVQYVKDNKCLPCPNGFTCDGATATGTRHYVSIRPCICVFESLDAGLYAFCFSVRAFERGNF